MVFFLENATIWQSLETFGLGIFFLRFLKSMGWYGFYYALLVVLNVFQQRFV